jgi:hypothetical protein
VRRNSWGLFYESLRRTENYHGNLFSITAAQSDTQVRALEHKASSYKVKIQYETSGFHSYRCEEDRQWLGLVES